MAEAVALPPLTNKYFCHQCNREVLLFQSEEMLCPECRSDFIEEVPDDQDDPDYEVGISDDSDVDESELNFLNLLSIENLFRRVVGENESPSRILSQNEADDGVDDADAHFGSVYSARTILQELEDNFVHGNRERLRHVGDYFFGDDLDAISTMLLNETEVVGPPPLPKDQMKLLPMVTVSKEDVEKEIQCTICMEDFAVREKAKCLPCSHFYHESCITPWLDRHATCPNCRKPVEIKLKSQRSQSCPRSALHNLRSTDQRRSSESTSSVAGFFTTSMNPFRFL